VETVGSWWMWAGFAGIVMVMLVVDLFVVGGGRQHRVSMREAAAWSGIWVAVSFVFAGALWWHLDGAAGRAVANETALEFVTGYLIEKSLAIDNVFVWLMLFSFFAVPLELQKRVLIYGVLGAIVMRTVMIFAGVWLIAKFHWLLYVFGAFLLITGIKMWWLAEEKPDLAENPAVKWIRRHMNVTNELQGERFFVLKEHGGKVVRYATPLFLVLVLVEITDLIFAGVWLIAQFHWLLYVFGAFLLITGIKMWWFADEKPDLANNPVVKWLRGHMNVTNELHGERFFVMKEQSGKWVRYATPLFLVLVLVEITDLIFAVDSIPAIFAITTDPFIVLTSNVFAILGLRSMYFLLADMADRFSLLKYGLAIVLMFVGVKMMLIDVFKIPVLISLGAVATIIAASIILSLRKDARERASAPVPDATGN
jgi:TerC family integral membrane protein